MPITKSNYEKAKALLTEKQGIVGSLAPDTFMYTRESEKLNRLRRDLQEFEGAQRQTDESGKLTAAPTHVSSPASVGEPSKDRPYNFHFEPTVSEAQEAVRRNPKLAQELGLTDLMGVAQPEKVEQVTDPMTGAVTGQTVSPSRTHLDMLSADSSQYKAIAQRLWEDRLKEAEAKGEPIQRYRDVKLGDQPLQYLTGGLEYNIDRRLAPAMMGVADSLSMGQAAPLYDAVRDVADYHQGRPATPEYTAPVTDPMTGMPMGENTVPASRPAQYELPPSSEGVIGRSPGMYLAGNIAGYGVKFNPVNLATEGAIKAAGYAGRGALGKLGVSAGVGAAANTVEGAVGDFSRALGQGQSFGDAASTAASNAPLNFAVGAVGGGAFDAAGQVAGMARETYRSQERLSGLKVLEEAGGGTHPWSGVQAPPEVQQAFDASKKAGAIGTGGAVLSNELAPSIEASLAKQAADEQTRIQQQMQEYFNHPTYGTIEVGSRPLLETLLSLASPGRFRGPVTGEARHIDPQKLKTIGKEFTNLAEVRYVPEAEAGAFAKANDGVPIDHELASQFYGDAEFTPGTIPIAVPRPLTAQLLTEMEERIYRELGISNRSAGNDDPVYRQLDRATKQMRDQFPYYTDEAGNLVEPPPTPSQAPFAPAADLPPAAPDRPSMLPRPVDVGGPPAQRPEAQPGIGPGQPALPSSPFDPRAPRAQPQPLSASPTRGVVDQPPLVRDAAPGVGPDLPLPQNPFDAEVFRPRPGYADAYRPPMEPSPQRRIEGPVERPDVLSPEAAPGAGQWRQPGLDVVRPQRTKAVTGGEYDRPPPVEPEPERAPDTLRNMGPKRPDDLEPPLLQPDEPFTGEDEAAQWAEGIINPGAPARSAEAKRMGDLMDQMRGDSESKAFEEAQFMVDNVDKRLGPLTEDQRVKMLTDVLRQKLGREVTREDLVKAGLITAGAVGAVTAEDDETVAAAAGVAGLGSIMSRMTTRQLREAYLRIQHEVLDAWKANDEEALQAAIGRRDAINDVIRSRRMDDLLREVPEDLKDWMRGEIEELRTRLGREVTKKDLIKAGLITAGAVGAVTAEDDETVAAAGVGGLVAALSGRQFSPKAKALLEEVDSYMSPQVLKKPTVIKSVLKAIDALGLSAEEAASLKTDVLDYHQRIKSEPDLTPPKPAPKAYVSEIDHTPDSGPREIGSSLKLGPRFRGDADDAYELLKKTKRELQPPPPPKVPYQPDPTHARGFDVSKPSKAIKELEMASHRKYKELDGEEKYAVDTWLGNSRIMREEQRNGIPLYTTGSKAPAFESAIDKLTVVNPTKLGALYRRFYAEDRELAELLSNDYYEAGASMSSSYYPNGTFGPHELRFKKVDQAGALLGPNSSEAEMVIPKGGRFKVLNRYYDPNTRGYVFELEEIPLTQENLLKEVGYLAVPFAAGAAVDEATGGDGEAAAAGAMVGAGRKRPKQLEATLDDGTKVRGFSALRRGQHTEQEAIERNKRRVGATGEETLPRRIQNFNQTKEGVRYDEALLEEARKIGKERELRNAAAANVYPELNDMRIPFGGNQGALKSLTDALMLRLDKPFEFMSGRFGPGQERNPFARAPGSMSEEMQQRFLSEPARLLMNLTGGRGARYSDSIYEMYQEEDRKQRQKEGQR